jgi:hypothetical protein
MPPSELLSSCPRTRATPSRVDGESEAVEYLRQCFVASDWAALTRNAHFAVVLSTVRTIEDVKQALALAEDIRWSDQYDDED